MAMKRRTDNLRRWRAALILLLAAAALYNPPRGTACGPFAERAVFTYSVHPDFPLAQFAAGHLGVLQPTYARSYLAVAYRYFAGAGFDKEEQKALADLWTERLQLASETGEESWPQSWLEARGKVPGLAASPKIELYRPVNPNDVYVTYLNCTQESFQSAATTLNRLVAKFGASSAQVRDWVAAQDQVFANCAGGQQVPPPASAGLPPPFAADRNYQIAAANFYSGNFDRAQSMFGQIAADPASAWRTLAPYMVARTLIRKATLTAPQGKVDEASLAQAEAQLKKALADAGLGPVHPAARRLLNFVSFRLHPEQRLRELAQAVLKKNSGRSLKQDLTDYTLLLDKFVPDEEEKKFDSLPKAGREDDVTDWALTFQVMDKGALDHSLSKWEQTSSLAWLVASISKINATHPKTPALVEAAAKVATSSPAFASVAYHSLRLMVESNKKDEARKRLDALLAQNNPTFPPSTTNLLMSLRMRVATSLDEFLKYAQRKPVGFTLDEDGRELPDDIKENKELKEFAAGRVAFDADAVEALNERLPVALLKEAATGKALAPPLRRELALSAWTRAALLGDEQTALALAPTVSDLTPALKELLDAYVAAASGEARKFAALYLMMKFPGTRPGVVAGVGRLTALGEIDSFRDNWWCSYARDTQADNAGVGGAGGRSGVAGKIDYPDFLTQAQKAAAATELKRLAALGAAPNYFAAQAVKWANANPDDPRAAESLHLAVRATRYGCTDKDTGRFSKLAFDTLHRKYPRSEWAQKTKYWFKE